MKKKVMTILMSILLGMLLPTEVLAYTSIDEGKNVSLTLTYELPEVSFAIFQVADITETAKYVLTEEFKEYPIELEEMDGEGWRDAAQTFSGYVERDGIVPSATGITDEEGILVFEELENGLYLVIGGTYTTEDRLHYEVMPFFVSLPTLTETDEWNYEPVVSPKYDVEELPEYISLQVIKIWEEDSSQSRPEKITVQILKNQEVYEEVELNSSNGWRYEWTELETGATWNVVEKEVPDNYTVKVSKVDNDFVITNTYGEVVPPESILPQTGQLWWPVPLLAAAGILLFAIGIFERGKRR